MSSWYRRLPCSKAASPLPADGCVSIPWPPKVSGVVHQLIVGAPLISAEHLGMQSSETCGRPGGYSVHHHVSTSTHVKCATTRGAQTTEHIPGNIWRGCCERAARAGTSPAGQTTANSRTSLPEPASTPTPLPGPVDDVGTWDEGGAVITPHPILCVI